MPTQGLDELVELDKKQRAILDTKLAITTCYQLIMVDRKRIVDAFGRRKNRPSIEDVGKWQDAARRKLASDSATAASAIADASWEQAGIFVVAFEYRQADDVVERRMVAEQTEVELDAASHQRSEWSDWACKKACRWMADRAGTLATAMPISSGEPVAELDAIEAGGDAPLERPRIVVERATLHDATGKTDLVEASRPLAQHLHLWDRPTRLEVLLGDAPTGATSSVILQLVRPGSKKENLVGRVDRLGRQAEIDLGELVSGTYTPTLVVRAPGGILPCLVKLGPVDVMR